MDSLLKRLITLSIAVLFLLLFMANVQYWFSYVIPTLETTGEITSQWFTLNVLLINESPAIKTVTMMLIIIAILSTVLNWLGSNHKMNAKTSYDKKSYSHLMPKWERRRGTVLVKYDDEGLPTESGF